MSGKLVPVEREQRAELEVRGYLRKHASSVSLPTDIIALLFKFYFLTYEYYAEYYYDCDEELVSKMKTAMNGSKFKSPEFNIKETKRLRPMAASCQQQTGSSSHKSFPNLIETSGPRHHRPFRVPLYPAGWVLPSRKKTLPR